MAAPVDAEADQGNSFYPGGVTMSQLNRKGGLGSQPEPALNNRAIWTDAGAWPYRVLRSAPVKILRHV